MLNNDFVAEKKETQSFPPLPEDMYTVELVDVASEKRPTYDTRLKPDNEKEYETVLNFQFGLLDGSEDGNSLRGRSVWANFVPSYLYISRKNGKNNLYKIVEALQGFAVSPQQEAEGISGTYLNSFVGKQCRVVTENKIDGDKVFTNINKFLPAKEQLVALTAEEKTAIRPKKDKEDKEEIPEIEYPHEEISAEDIPFN